MAAACTIAAAVAAIAVAVASSVAVTSTSVTEAIAQTRPSAGAISCPFTHALTTSATASGTYTFTSRLAASAVTSFTAVNIAPDAIRRIWRVRQQATRRLPSDRRLGLELVASG